jgi:hypothetical protein
MRHIGESLAAARAPIHLLRDIFSSVHGIPAAPAKENHPAPVEGGQAIGLQARACHNAKGSFMKQTVITALAIAALGAAAAATAQESATSEQPGRLSPEQREAVKARAQKRWQEMSPEEQAAAKTRFRERYERMSPERQAEVRQRLQERNAARQQ